MLAAHRDFVKFRGGTEREFLAWLRQILINCLHHVIDTHVKSKMRDIRCEISIEQVNTALDRTAINIAQILVGDLTHRISVNRPPLPAIALSCDGPLVGAIAEQAKAGLTQSG